AGDNKTGQALSAIGANIPITITDPSHQTQDIGTIRRDTENTNTSLPGLPDLQNILRDQYKTQADLQAAQKTMAGLVGDIADGLRDHATTQAEHDLWAEGGQGRALLHAIGGGILGGVNGWEGAIKGALGGATTTLMAPAIANLVKGMLKDSTLSDAEKTQLATLIGASLSAAVGGAVGGGEGAAYGAANYQYNYLTHKQLEEAKKLAAALAKCEGIIQNCASYNTLTQDVEAYRKLSAENTAALINECSQGPSATCLSMMMDLKQFNEAVDAEFQGMQSNPRGSSPQSSPTPNQVRYYEAVDGGLRLDHLVEQQFTAVLAGSQSPEQARRNIITTVVQSTKNRGQLNAILNGIGLVGSGVVLVLSDGTALPLLAGGLGAVSSGSHLYGDIQQGITGVITEPGLVQLLKANDISPDNAVAVQNLIDLGALITGLGVGLKPTLLKSAAELTSAERSLVNSGVLTLDEAAALPRVITTSNGQKITLPPGYRPIAGVGSAGNDVGGLPDGFARATDVKGNIVIVGTDGNIYASVADAQQAALGAMDGLSFRFDLAGHLVGPDGFIKNGRLSGTHNLNNATAELNGRGATYSLNPTTTPGIDELQYTYVQPSGKAVSGSKTVYDPAVFSDQAMVDLAQKAAQQAWTKFLQNQAITAPIDNTVGGVNFRSYINFDANGNPFVGNVHPIK
ncbi:CdiA family toxin C-terminal domain-containing protein, partial [Rhizobium rhizogenes]|uniref:CdiA family toxin C-terminal domain-containing protein n=1 Tax=Rhizobium rhizogenes TaxID=359 RepID=UPI001F25EA77